MEEKNNIDGESTSKLPKLKGKPKKKIIAIIAVIVVIIIVVSALARGGKKKNDSSSQYTFATAEKMDITESLSGSGTLQPADQYTVSTLLSGEILSDTFEEGDVVKKDQVLYQMDSSDAQRSIEKAQLNASSAQRNYSTASENLSDLNVKSKVNGTVVDMLVELGDKVNAGQQVATVRDDSTMSLELDFPADEAENFYVGESAVVTLYGSFETLNGNVAEISGATNVGTGNTIVKKVKINVTNPGAISDSQIATAEVGSSASTSSGTFTYKENRAVYAEVSGDVSRIVADEGTRVSNGSTIIALESSSVRNSVSAAADSVKDAQLSLESQYDNLDDFTIKSPIDGTIISKDQKAGDTIDSNTKLCTIYDLSYLKITMNVDELDISKVSVGQKVQITADAVSGQTFEGKVTSVNLAGTTTNGVTTYPVEVQITDYGDLLPGMNVDTYIVVNEVKDVLGVPAAAISRGNRVLVQTGNKSDDTSIPSGYEYVEVETGVSSDDFVEIKSGINEGDSVAYIETGSSVDPFAMMMSGGVAPSGGGSYGGGGGDAGDGAPGGGPQ